MFLSPRLTEHMPGKNCEDMLSMVKLKVTISATGEKFDFNLTQHEVKIGRHPDSDIVAKDNRVSRLHAVIEGDAETYRIKDPQSHNGTTVNGVEIPHNQWQPLTPGDQITLAKGAVLLEL